MEAENNQKSKTKRKTGRTKTLTIKVPTRVHEVITDYQKKITYDRGRFYNIKLSYVEYLKEKTGVA